MASTTTTTHKTNVTNLDKFLIELTAYGAYYNPSKASIRLDALTILFNNVKAANTVETDAYLLYNNAKNARADSYAVSTDIITRVANAVRSSDISDKVAENVLVTIRKFLGRSTTVKQETSVTTTEGTKTVVTKSYNSSKQDIDSKLTYLETIIKQLATIPSYTPNEANLKVDYITTIYNDMREKRTIEETAKTAHNNAIIATDKLMYSDDTGIIDLFTNAKTYVKSLYGASSPQYKALTHLKFKKYVRR